MVEDNTEKDMLKEEDRRDNETVLLPVERYLEYGVHIGTKVRTDDTKPFIYKRRRDKIYIIDISKIDKYLRDALNIIKKYNPKDITIVATRIYAINAAKKLKKVIPEVDIITKRFVPGTFTNPESNNFREPELLIVLDPNREEKAVKEANRLHIPIVGLIDTNNKTKGIDYPVPFNNKGRKSLALFFWLLARELMLANKKIENYGQFRVPISFFEELEE